MQSKATTVGAEDSHLINYLAIQCYVLSVRSDVFSTLRVKYTCGVVLVFWFWGEIVFGITYVLGVQYSCAVVSVFWFWQEIVLKMRTRFYKKILLGYFIMIR